MIAGLVARDPAWTEAFVRGAHRAVFVLAARLTRDAEQREDWTHSTLLRVIDDVREQRFVLRHPGAFWSWFRKRSYFLLLDRCRTARRREARETGGPEPDTLPDLSPFGAGDPAREFERVALRADIEDCLGRVPHADQQRALGLLLEQELGYEEIATAMSAPLNTVKTWIRRGRAALRECLSRRWGIS